MANDENILTVKISRSTVVWYTVDFLLISKFEHFRAGQCTGTMAAMG